MVEMKLNWTLPLSILSEGNPDETGTGALPAAIQFKEIPGTLQVMLPDGQTLDTLLKFVTGLVHKFAIGNSSPAWSQEHTCSKLINFLMMFTKHTVY